MEDALFIVRCLVEQALAATGGKCLLLALEWRKALDIISPHRLIWALGRFGVGEPMLSLIKKIYTGRHFTVADAGDKSINRPQLAGISPKCPLSPFLFGMVMTVPMTNAKNALSEGAKAAYENKELEHTLFADDTLLISSNGEHVEEEYMSLIEERGRDYELEVGWRKVHGASRHRHSHPRASWNGNPSETIHAIPRVNNTCRWKVRQ